MEKIKLKKISIIDITFFFCLLIYMLNASIYQLPANELFRWIFVLILFLVVVTFKLQNSKVIISKYICFLFIPYLSTVKLIFDIGLKESIFRSISFFIVFFTLFFLFNSVDDKEKQKLLDIFGIVLSICTVLCFFLFIKDNSIGNFKGIYLNKNYLITILLVSNVNSIKYIYENKKIIGILLFLMNTVMNFATGSRVGIICYFVMLFYMVVLWNDTFSIVNIMKIFVLFVIVLLVIYIIIQNMDIPAVDRILNSDGSAATGLSRKDVWSNAIPIFLKKPILGWGNNIAYLNIHKITNIGKIYDWGFHNSYLVILCECGIIGGISYCIFFMHVIIKTLKIFKNNIYNKCMLGIIVLLLINGLSEAFIFAVGNFASICIWIPITYVLSYKNYN